jgi:hypothetical protein
MPPFIHRALLVGIVCALIGALELWVGRFDLRNLAAALAAGAVYGILLGLFTSLLNGPRPLAMLSAALFGSAAGAVWWFVAQPPSNPLLALVIGFGVGGLFPWLELG